MEGYGKMGKLNFLLNISEAQVEDSRLIREYQYCSVPKITQLTTHNSQLTPYSS